MNSDYLETIANTIDCFLRYEILMSLFCDDGVDSCDGVYSKSMPPVSEVEF